MTRKFFNCLIGISQLERFINTINFQDKTNQNDIFFLKIFMGVYQHFYLEFDYPLFDVKYNFNFDYDNNDYEIFTCYK